MSTICFVLGYSFILFKYSNWDCVNFFKSVLRELFAQCTFAPLATFE